MREASEQEAFANRLARLLTGQRTILYLGASVTAQKESYCHAFHDLLCRVTGHAHEFHRIAEGGASSAYALALLLQSLRDRPRRYDLVFLETLTGDLNLLVPPAVVPAVLGATADAVRDQGGELCMIKLPRLDRPDDHPITLAYDESAAELGLPVLDVSGFGRPEHGAEPLSRMALRDGIHTTEAGSVLFGASLLSRLLSPDAAWPEPRSAPGFGAPLRQRLGRLQWLLDDLDWRRTDGLERDVFRAPSGERVHPVVLGPAEQPIEFAFSGYIAYFLFVSAPDSAMIELTFQGVARRTPLLDRYGHFPHLHMKSVFRDFREGDEIRILGLDELPHPNPVPSEHRHLLSKHRKVRFLGVIGAPGPD
ncbi:SGNH/GDSL hydrolase family protein [Hansschlegelia zhihuaiae]|uniref:SGNH/GDSL hydrolase family protein n=1 Tax=Hansschlegelia zhihuaiae TaxID=405005 RepID=A0A4Q0MLA3_9HYPH|nr:SGNH/GDSL hydrolase family protein [Hansschlegelia zhihuaiae]RXF74470.1 SGNH/GDSL hydrolase family protein [Hansschlegelia zhihuaiae]